MFGDPYVSAGWGPGGFEGPGFPKTKVLWWFSGLKSPIFHDPYMLYGIFTYINSSQKCRLKTFHR